MENGTVVGFVETIVVAKVVALTLAAVGLVILWPVRRALTRRFETLGGADAMLQQELGRLQARVGELESVERRLAELEERLDFMERLVTQREPARLEPGR